MRLVDGDVGQIVQDLGAAIRGGSRRQQLRAFLDERRRDVSGAEVRVVQNCLQKRDIGGHTADAELGDRATGTSHRSLEVPPATRQLHQHRIEMRTHLGAEGGATVEADARATGAAVGGDSTGVGPEAIGRILGGNPALQGRTARRDGILVQTKVIEGFSGGDPQLTRHQVHIGDLLGHRVLHLNSGIHLNEDVVTALVEQELNGAGAAVPDVTGESDSVRTDLLTQFRRQVGRGSELDDLLMAPLHATVALVEVNDVSRGVRQDLHLDMPRVDDSLLQENRRVSERGLCLAAGCLDRLAQLITLGDPPHTAPATTGNGLDEHRKFHGLGGRQQLLNRCRRLRGCQHRQSRLTRSSDGTGLVTRQLQNIGGRPDKRDAGLCAGRREVGILGQEAVAGVDRIGAGIPGSVDDLGNRQIGADRMALLTNLIGLIGLQPMTRVAIFIGVDSDGFGT
ncbi:Uncharacterised protein [Mycobacteroides abscessus subsp. abscessus]|nr:Uncharacterised protein [Mycobacteroides abscessus subsp. abscessus]